MKPRGLGATTVAMAILNLGGFVGIQRTRGVLAMVLLVVLLGYVVLWYYWQGRNWARTLVMITSALTIVGLLAMIVAVLVLGGLYWDSKPVLYHLVVVANAALGAFLLYWLNKKDVRAWFRKSEPDARVLI